MRGIYTAKRKTGTAVYIDYQPPDMARVREKIELVPSGPNLAKRLSEARKRAQKELVRRQAAACERAEAPLAPPQNSVVAVWATSQSALHPAGIAPEGPVP